jgi:hypothetical protein
MIPAAAFDDIIDELERRPLELNNYRVKTGSGRSQAFGIVGRRSAPPDYSRQCWLRPELYSHLLDFGETYVKDISWNAITLNQNFLCKPHYDKHNRGPSFLCAFGDYEGGELVIHEGDLSGNYDLRHNSLITDFSKVLHSVTPFTGNRYSVVYYYFEIAPYLNREYLKGEVRFVGGNYVFYRGGVRCKGLPHPLNGYKRKPKIDKSDTSVAANDGSN